MSRAFIAVLMGAGWLAMDQSAAAQPPRPRPEPREERRQERIQERQERQYGAVTEVRRISSIIGSSIFVQGDRSVGKIEDLVLSENGCVDFLVVFHEGKFVLVPWNAARVDFERRSIFLEIPREKFMEVPTFAKDQWPNLHDNRYVEKLYTFYGLPPGHERKFERREHERHK
jgi:hypothetical protein